MTREEAFKEINETQDFYINELVTKINSKADDIFKVLNFQSATGTGKTKMIAKLINKFPNIFFIITTLSKGQLDRQIATNLASDCQYNNFKVYGTQKYTINSKLQAEDILSLIPEGVDFIWLRDEGHINTNRWEDLLKDKAYKMINFTATPDNADIKCNFTNTMMLRTVHQQTGTPEDAINKLLEIKEQHSKVTGYNPCAIFRCIDDKSLLNNIIKQCKKHNLKYINITEEDFDMSDLCRDDNGYDVIINKFKIVEGIDIRRAHVLYMDNQPSNNKTTIQVIGRCRRNALLYRNDIDIFAKENKALLENTRQCFVYYNVEQMRIDEDENGELVNAFCDTISVEQLKADSIITVDNGMLPNGLKIIELEGESGTYQVLKDPSTGFNIVKPENDFYTTVTMYNPENYATFKIVHRGYDYINNKYGCIAEIIYVPKKEILQNWFVEDRTEFNYALGENIAVGKTYSSKREIKNTYTIKLNSQEHDELIKSTANEVSFEYKFGVLSDYYKIHKTKKKGIYYTVYRFITPEALKDRLTIDISTRIINRLNREFKIKDDTLLYYDTTLNDWQVASQKAILKIIKTTINSLFDTVKNEISNCFTICSFENIVFNTKQKAIEYIKTEFDNFKAANATTVNIKFNPENLKEILITKTETINLIDNYRKQADIKWFGKSSFGYTISDEALGYSYFDYTKQYNDRESAIIGVDKMKQIKDKDTDTLIWIEDRAVTSKISKATKLNTFIEQRYATQLAKAESQLFSGKNNFKFDSKCNSCLGYCAEYYSKYLVYGKRFLEDFIMQAQAEAKVAKDFINDNLIIRACMLKYREMMVAAYGKAMSKVIKTIGVQQLIKDEYKEFVSTVIKLGTKTAEFVKKELGITKDLEKDEKLYDPNLSIRHITGLADYIDKNTIIDIKTTNSITRKYIKQVLAYHYLSTKRSDLDIKRVIVYDAVSGRSVKIDL